MCLDVSRHLKDWSGHMSVLLKINNFGQYLWMNFTPMRGFYVRSQKHTVKPSMQSSDSNRFWQHLFLLAAMKVFDN